jgi:hypothetical protein
LSLATKNTRPIKIDDLLWEIHNGRLDIATYLPYGVNVDGTLITIREPSVLGKGRNRRTLTLGKLHHYTVTDVPSAAGGFNITNTFFPAVNSASLQTFVVPAGYSFPGVGVYILKTAIAFTNGVAGSRILLIAGGQTASKFVGPGVSGGDLLDREVGIPAGTFVSLANSQNGDSVNLTHVRVG